MTTPTHKDDYFIPLNHEETLDIPETLSGDKEPSVLSDPSLALKPMRFISRAAKGVFALIMVFVVWQSIEFFRFLNDSHWILASIFAVLVLGLLGIVGNAALEFFRYQKDFKEVDQLQAAADGFRKAHSTGQGKHWISRLQSLYQGKPHQELLDKALSSLPDYADDSEIIQHIDSHLFQKLDQQAMARVTRHSQQTALMVAISPVAVVDMLLSVWRCLKMIDEICQIYGLRPSLPARSRLLKLVLSQIALAGAADLIAEHLTDMASNKLISTVSTQAASGVGVGLYTARIGFLVMEFCRPAPFTHEQRPGLGVLAKKMYSSIMSRFQKSG